MKTLRFQIFTVNVISLAFLLGSQATYAAADLSPGIAIGADLAQSELSCSGEQPYILPTGQPNAAAMNFCKSCSAGIKSAGTALKDSFSAANAGLAGATAGTQLGVSAADPSKDAQKALVSGNKDQTNVGNAGANAMSGEAAKASAAGAQCKADIEKSCGNPSLLSQTDKSQLDQAKQACDKAKSVADNAKGDADKAGSGMGDMASLLGAAAQALGPLAQMMAGQPESPSSAISPPSIAAPSRSTFGDIGSSQPTVGVGLPGGSESKVAVNSAGSSPFSAASRSFDSESNGLSGSTAENSVNAGSKSTPSGASGAGGSFGSSGASKAPEEGEGKSVAAAGDPSLESMFGGGGGGGGRPLLGLKGKSADLDPILDPLGNKNDLGLGESGDRSLASTEGEQGEGEFGDSEASLFLIVHSKIKEMKKRGSI